MPKKAETTPKRPARRTHEPAIKSSKSSGTGKKLALRAGKSSTESDDSNSPAEGNSSLVKPININIGVLKKAKEHARQLGIKTLKEYSESALLYFIKNGIDPTAELESGQVSVEVTRLRNQVFSFLQKQEQAYILPIFREVTGQSGDVEKTLSTMVGQLEKVYDLLYRINQMVHVSTSTTLFVSGLPQDQIEDIKEKNRTFVETQVSEFKQKKQS